MKNTQQTSMQLKELTKSEDQVMQILWKLDKAFVKDIVAEFDEPKPAYNTVSTIVRILEKKGFIGYKAYGKTHEYFAMVARDEYNKFFLNKFVGSYFGGSFQKLVSFFAKENDMNIQQIEQLMEYVEKDVNSKKE